MHRGVNGGVRGVPVSDLDASIKVGLRGCGCRNGYGAGGVTGGRGRAAVGIAAPSLTPEPSAASLALAEAGGGAAARTSKLQN